MKKLPVSARDVRAVWMLLIVGIALVIATPRFMTTANLLNVVLAVSVTALLAAGETYVIILGEIDLSVGAALGFTSVITALALQRFGFVIALLSGLAAGLLVGAANGILTTKANMPSFIVTLATLSMLSGLTLYITQGNPIAVDNNAFINLGQGQFLGVPNPIWIMLVFALVFGIVLARTRYGRQTYATGDNPEAATLSGIPVDRVKIRAFMISGMLSAVGGFILTSRLGSAQPTAGTGLELTAIAAVIIGGTSLSGGRGALIGTIIGALLLGFIDNGLNLLNVSSFLQNVVKGAVILFAVFIDRNALSVRALLSRARRRTRTVENST